MKRMEYSKFEIQEGKRERLICAPAFADRVVEREVKRLCQQQLEGATTVPDMIPARRSPW